MPSYPYRTIARTSCQMNLRTYLFLGSEEEVRSPTPGRLCAVTSVSNWSNQRIRKLLSPASMNPLARFAKHSGLGTSHTRD